MSAFLRTSRNTAISMPWWLAIPVGLCWLLVWLMILFYGLIAMLVLVSVRAGARAWRARAVSDWAAGIEKHWPLLVVTVWRPPVAGLEDLGWQRCETKLYEVPR